MSAIEDIRPDQPGTFQGAINAIVATTALDIIEEVMVTIPGFHSQYQWGPCKWMPRGDSVTYPQRGDKALIIFDDVNDPWIIAWWPF